MLEPILCGPLAGAPLLPKLRGHFAEFLDNASPVGLGILSPSTCVGLRYGCVQHDSGFSRHAAHALPYSCSVHVTAPDCGAGLPAPLLLRLCRASPSRLTLSACVPTFLAAHSTGISTCCPSATPLGLALGPDSPRADRLYPGNLGYSAGRIPTSLSLLIPAFSLPAPPPLLAGAASAGRQCSSTDYAGPLSLRNPQASAACFSPGHFRRGTSRLVSYYALFECVAASEPTS